MLVADPMTFNEQSLECDQTVLRRNIGEDQTLRCLASFGQGNLPSEDVHVLLEKVS